MIESSKFEPVVFPLQVTMMIPTEDYKGGSLGQIRASDQDPHDQLYYDIVLQGRSQEFQIDLENGSLRSVSKLVEGSYSMNISVSDGKFTTFSPATVEVNDVEDSMIQNGLIVVLGGANPEDFLISYRTSFLRSVASILDVAMSEVIILSIQHTPKRSKRQELIENYRLGMVSYAQRPESDISVLFCARKSRRDFYTRRELFNQIMTEIPLMEATMGLRVLRIEGDMCHNITCTNGYCEDIVSLGADQVVIATEAVNFVSLKHSHDGICVCPTGYGGRFCGKILNQCAYKPCPKYKICLPDESERGFSCNCPDGFVGGVCSKRVSECVGYQGTPACFSPTSPISFSGRSFAQYSIRSQIDSEFKFTTWFRTVQSSGNLMFIAGRIDYSVIEVGVKYFLETASGLTLETL